MDFKHDKIRAKVTSEGYVASEEDLPHATNWRRQTLDSFLGVKASCPRGGLGAYPGLHIDFQIRPRLENIYFKHCGLDGLGARQQRKTNKEKQSDPQLFALEMANYWGCALLHHPPAHSPPHPPTASPRPAGPSAQARRCCRWRCASTMRLAAVP